MANLIKNDGYNEKVVGLGDKYSGNFKEFCDIANRKTSVAKNGYLEENGNIWQINTSLDGIKKATESIDGVGTKVQIYTAIFNKMIEELESGLVTEEEVLKQSTELWERMLRDLIAMNVDDLRDGEMAIAVTNIIDINHLEGLRGKNFAESMKKALSNVIKDLDIAMTAGETAVLGEHEKVGQIIDEVLNPQKVTGIVGSEILSIIVGNKKIKKLLKKDKKLKDFLVNSVASNTTLLQRSDKNTAKMVEEIIENSFKTYKDSEKRLEVILKNISFNIGGTGLGVIGEENKLTEVKKGQYIVYIQEQPTKEGIIGPRSNGLTRIREAMDKLLGKGRENMTFEDFLQTIGKEKASLLSKKLKKECKNLKMWNIATGKTTVFNPLISRKILGGVKGKPIADIASIIHVTGNPIRKIAEGLRGNRKLGIELDISSVKIPQIIEILQVLGAIDGEDAIGSWNMGIPYALICNSKKDTKKVIKEAEKNGFTSGIIGKVVERKKKKTIGKISGVGIGNDKVVLKEKKKK